MEYYTWPISLLTVVFGRKKMEEDSEYQPPSDLEASIEYVMLTRLTEQEYTALKLRVKDKLSLEQCGIRMNVSKSRIGQLVENGILKLKNPNISRYLYHGMHYCMIEDVDRIVKERFDTKYEKLLKLLNQVHKEVEVLTEEDENGVIKGMSVDELEFSVRTYNGLRKAGFDTVGDIIRHENEITHNRVRNIGKVSYIEIAAKMRDLGFTYFGAGNKDIDWSLRKNR